MSSKRKKQTGGGTRATVALTAAGVPFEIRSYDVPRDAGESTAGEVAAAALGLPPDHVFKTLVADVGGVPVCAIVPTSGTLSLKALASAAGGKRARMVDPADAERLTGYATGGISPLGQLRSLPTYVDASALRLAVVHVSAGRRGLQLALAAADLVSASGAVVVDGLVQ